MTDHDADKDYYASIADEMNDPDVGAWDEDEWEPDAVAGGKRYAERAGLPWPPSTGDYDRFYERSHR